MAQVEGGFVAEHPIEAIDRPADERRVRQKVLLVAVAIVAAAGLVGGRALTLPGPSPAASSDKTSPCGQVGLSAAELGLGRARELTFCLLNEQRARHGLGHLRYEARLELAAQRHAEDMVRRKYFEHDTPEGVEQHSRALATGYPANNAFTAENIAWGEGAASSPVEIMDGWLHSPPHRDAILHPSLAEVGVGIAMGAPERDSSGPAATYATSFGGPPLR
jgi:Cysteine-rich secretory protein family